MDPLDLDVKNAVGSCYDPLGGDDGTPTVAHVTTLALQKMDLDGKRKLGVVSHVISSEHLTKA